MERRHDEAEPRGPWIRAGGTAGGVLAGVLVVYAASAQPVRAAEAAPPGADRVPVVPVVVELFTSEGCSSCPPADDLLRNLAGAQPVPGAEIVPLEEHVTYWDRLGWRDPFSQPLFTTRQSGYDAQLFHRGEVYTPQAVVDGRWQLVGSDRPALVAAIAAAARQPQASVTLSLLGLVPAAAGPGRPSYVHVVVKVPPDLRPAGTADVVLAVTEDDLQTHVLAGENRGRQLHHSAVVRTLRPIGMVSADAPELSVTRPLTLDAGWNPAHLGVVVFVQERLSRRIIGAGRLPLSARPSIH